jgi:glycine amidinotransferase
MFGVLSCKQLARRGAKVQHRFLASAKNATPVVNSHNEFDPLEEVIVGRVEGSTIPEWHVSGKAVWPNKWWDMYKTKAGQPFPKELMTKGKLP